MRNFLWVMLINVLMLTSCQSKAFENETDVKVETPPKENPSSVSPIKGICIFVGQAETFTSDDWQALANSPLTDFIIIPKDVSTYGDTEAGYKSQLAPFMANATNQIITRKNTAKVWIGTPGLSSTNFNLAASNLQPFYNYLDQVRTLLGNSTWNNNIGGVYMNMESIYGTVDYSNITGNSCIKLMSDLSNLVHTNLNTKFLWIPYYGYGSNPDEIIKRMAYISNKSTIFDYVVIQPHYYFDGTVGVNLVGVKSCVKNQAISYRDGSIVTPKASKTVIGAEMELDWHIVAPNNYSANLSRYTEYVTSFGQDKGTYPIIFYWDGTLQNALTGRINPFFQ